MISFGKTTRGEGKIYIEIDVNDKDFDHLELSSRTITGRTLPCSVVRTGVTSSVIVLPVVAVTQKIEVIAYDAAGVVLSAAKKSVGSADAALRSKINTTLSSRGIGVSEERIERVRNADHQPSDTRLWVRVTSIFRIEEKDLKESNKCDLAHVVVVVPELGGGMVSIRVLDTRGKVVASSATIIKDSLETADRWSCAKVRVVEARARIPRSLKSFIVQAELKGETELSGFCCVRDFESKDLRRKTDSRILYTGLGGIYDSWFRERHRASSLALHAQRMSSFDIEPLYSIIVPLYKTPLPMFEEMAQSVLTQTYPKFELLLVNASPEDEALSQLVSSYAEADSRIRVIDLDDNYGITLNTNEGIRAASGDFLCFFDHDDVMEPDLLFEYTKEVNLHPDTDLLYCDEDKLVNGRYIHGQFKPDFDWELICAGNYVTHLLVVRKSIVDDFDELPGKEFDGSQDHNMTIAVAEKARHIAHISKALYHWRIHAASTASAPEAKTWTLESGRLAIERHFSRIGVDAVVSNHPNYPNYYQVDYAEPAEGSISVLVMGASERADIQRAVEIVAGEQSRLPRDFVVVIDEGNATLAQAVESLAVEGVSITALLVSEDTSLVERKNLAAEAATGEYLLFFSADLLSATAGWLSRLTGHMQKPDVACVAPRLVYPDGLVLNEGYVIPKDFPVMVNQLVGKDDSWYFMYRLFPSSRSAVASDCMLVRSDAFRAAGGFIGDYGHELSDVDFCLRLWDCNKAVVVEPRAELAKQDTSLPFARPIDSDYTVKEVRERGLFMAKWAEIISEGDPFYNKNLDLGFAHYQLDFSNRLV